MPGRPPANTINVLGREPHCGRWRRLLMAIQEQAAIRKVIEAMGLSAAARSPPGEVGMEFSG